MAIPRFPQAIPLDDYVLDVLMRDLVGHDRHPAAYLVYLHLYAEAFRHPGRSQPVRASLRAIAEATGLSKSAVQVAIRHLRRRQLVVSQSAHRTAAPVHRILRHWRR